MIRAFGGNTPRIDASSFIHDSSEVIGKVSIAKDASVWPMAVLRADVDAIRVGERSNIQDLTMIHCREGSPAVIGKGVTVGHRAVIHGSRIGDGCLIGMGSVIMETSVGAQSLVAAGALVLRGLKIPPRSLVMGSPARVVRRLSRQELAQLRASAETYVRLARAHARGSKVVFKI